MCAIKHQSHHYMEKLRASFSQLCTCICRCHCVHSVSGHQPHHERIIQHMSVNHVLTPMGITMMTLRACRDQTHDYMNNFARKYQSTLCMRRCISNIISVKDPWKGVVHNVRTHDANTYTTHTHTTHTHAMHTHKEHVQCAHTLWAHAPCTEAQSIHTKYTHLRQVQAQNMYTPSSTVSKFQVMYQIAIYWHVCTRKQTQ